jgi:hypothetical protein
MIGINDVWRQFDNPLQTETCRLNEFGHLGAHTQHIATRRPGPQTLHFVERTADPMREDDCMAMRPAVGEVISSGPCGYAGRLE